MMVDVLNRAMQMAELEAYLTDLRAEVQAVEEPLADLHRSEILFSVDDSRASL